MHSPQKSRDVGISPTARFSVKVTLWLPELSIFCKVTASKFTAEFTPHQYINVETQKALRPSNPDECILYYVSTTH